MSARIRNALVVFSFLAVAIAIAVSVDYTDTYVAARFHKTLSTEQYKLGDSISLDRYIEYYDWDLVHVILPGQELPDLSNQFGLPYRHSAKDGEVWSLVFVKDDYVVAEIPIERTTLEMPEQVPQAPYDRWHAFIVITNDNGIKRMEFVGE